MNKWKRSLWKLKIEHHSFELFFDRQTIWLNGKTYVKLLWLFSFVHMHVSMRLSLALPLFVCGAYFLLLNNMKLLWKVSHNGFRCTCSIFYQTFSKLTRIKRMWRAKITTETKKSLALCTKLLCNLIWIAFSYSMPTFIKLYVCGVLTRSTHSCCCYRIDWPGHVFSIAVAATLNSNEVKT